MKKKKFASWIKLTEKEIYILTRALENWPRPKRLVSAQEVNTLKDKLATPILAVDGEAVLADEGRFGPQCKTIPWPRFFWYYKKTVGLAQLSIRLRTYENILKLIDDGTLMPGRTLQRRLWEIYSLDVGKTLEETLDE